MNMKIACCGYDCSTCLGWIAYHIESEHEQEEYLKVNSGVIPCAGCRSVDNVCEKTCGTCNMRKCSMSKSITFCKECIEYPCTYFKKE